MTVFRCKMCGGTLDVSQDARTATCEYCGSVQTLPNLNDDKIARLYDRANHFRRNNEFDKAMGIYEQILEEDTEDAEAYWSLILCRYGIEYVEDPASHKRIPTVNRAQFTSIFDDDNYISAIKYADTEQKLIYESEARAINEIQKGILEISQKEEPFDVFICYKETDERGQRTRDSVYANELYHELTEEGFKVFYARITLEDKLGEAYEPYIFAALNSAKIMVVIGTKPEYFNAVWVKNEWSRYLLLIKGGAKKALIPAYSGMDPYDLPQEFSHLQAQDMTKLGFMPDLVRGIRKLVGREDDRYDRYDRDHDRYDRDNEHREARAAAQTHGETSTLLRRVSIFLDNQGWESADIYCEKVLDIDPENADAYIGKILAELHCSNEAQLENQNTPLERLPAYKNAVRFADEECAHRLTERNRAIKERLERAERERAERELAEKLRRQAEEKKRQEIARLGQAKNNVASLLTSQVRQKESLEALIRQKNQELTSKTNPKRAKKIAWWIIILAIFEIAVFVKIGETPGDPAVASVIFLFVGAIMYFVFGAKLARADKKSGALTIINFFSYGLFSFIYAIVVLNKYKKSRIPDTKKEIAGLSAQLASIESEIDKSRRSLNEINTKLQNI